jgi:prepilin-type N-terminal cleavage/methylation domain-containing protein
MPSTVLSADRGFSLLELLVATTLVVIGMTALAQLFGVAIQANARGRAMTVSVLFARQKLEEVVAAFAQQDQNGSTLGASPAGSLDRNTTGFSDYLDRSGQSLGGGATVPSGAEYLRRWSVEPLPGYEDTARVLQVLTTHIRGAGDVTSDVTRWPETARLMTVRTRRNS